MKRVAEVTELKEGGFVIIDGEPSRIVSIQTSKTGKHGSAKSRVEAIGIFDNQKRSIVKPVDTKIDVPIIEKKSAQVVALMGEKVQLMDLETYAIFEAPIVDEVKGKLAAGVEVEYLEALGRRKILRTK